MRRIIPIFFLAGLLLQTQAMAGDAATMDFMGFSKDGKYLAFEQYGVTGGRGTPYSEIFLVNVERNSYVTKPFKTEMDLSPEISENDAREENWKKARTKLNQFEILEGNQGLHAVSHPLNDLGADPKKVRFTPGMPLGGLSYTAYEITLRETTTKKECFGFGNAKIFTLTLTNQDSKQAQALQKDRKLHRSRGCPLNYRIQDVFVYDDKYIAVFLNMFRLGFEGQSMRYLVVTGTLN
ncbi:MAG: DUF2259 domain-containing protein [Gammaproteobacteria bacterium]|nr:DUF2259 domain-containing protein [Gammaproteobacteria bacterium]